MNAISPSKGNTLLLTICQKGFETVVDGSMERQTEFRPIKSSTLSRYVLRNKKGFPYLDLAHTSPTENYKIDDYNGGNFPFLLRQYDFLHFAVGYTSERDECIVRVEEVVLEARNYAVVGQREICEWWIGFKMSRPIVLRRKTEVETPKIYLEEGENTINRIPEGAIAQQEKAK